MSSSDTTENKAEADTATTPCLSQSSSPSPSVIADNGIGPTGLQTQSEVLQSPSRLPRPLHLRPPTTAISSSSSSLDSCLAAFPLQPAMPSEESTSCPPPVHHLPPIVTCSPLNNSSSMSTSNSNCNSPLLSAIVDMSECSTLNESAVASSDDAMCSSPLLAEIKDRRFSAKREPVLKEALQSHPSLSYIRALGHWQEQAFPPVPAIPAQFQDISTGKCTGWTRCEAVDGGGDGSSEPAGEVVKGDAPPRKELHRQSMTNSSRITLATASEHSLDTCASSVITHASTKRSCKRDSLGAGLLKMNPMVDKKMVPPLSKKRDSRSPFAFNAEVNQSTSSLASRATSRPDTASKRIAFAPSVRIGTSTPSRDNTMRKANYAKCAGSRLDEMRNEAAERSGTDTLPPPPPPKEDRRQLLTVKTDKPFLARPSTAPHPNNRKAAAENTFKKLLRPISRQHRENSGEGRFSRPLTAKSITKMDDSDAISIESSQSIHAPLHLDGPFGRSHPFCMASPLVATRVEDLPRPPRAFYPGTLILVKDDVEQAEKPPVPDREASGRGADHALEQDTGGCPSYMDAVAIDTRVQVPTTTAGRNSVVWSGEPVQVKADKRGGLQKLKRVVTKVTEAFAVKVAAPEKMSNQAGQWNHNSQVRTKEASLAPPAKSRASSRPSTAPSLASLPRWGSQSMGKVAKIVSRYEQASQSSILVGQPSRERLVNHIEVMRNGEELRKRHTPWDSQPGPSAQDRLYPPDYLGTPHSYSRAGGTSQNLQQQQQQPERVSSAAPSAAAAAAAAHTLQHPYRIALIPVSRVSPDQLKRMQPVKIVKYPVVDAPVDM